MWRRSGWCFVLLALVVTLGLLPILALRGGEAKPRRNKNPRKPKPTPVVVSRLPAASPTAGASASPVAPRATKPAATKPPATPLPPWKPWHQVALLTGHTGSVRCGVVLPDGKRALTGGKDTSVRLWDLLTGAELRQLVGHTEQVNAVAVSPDGKRALSGGGFIFQLWDLETGQTRATIPALSQPTAYAEAAAFSADGRRALLGYWHDRVVLWNLEQNAMVWEFGKFTGNVNAVFFLPDGQRALVSAGTQLQLHDLQNGAKTWETRTGSGFVELVAVAADGRRALAWHSGYHLQLWDLETLQLVRELPPPKSVVLALEISPDGRLGLTGGRDSAVRVWDLEAGTVLQTLTGHAGEVRFVRFLPGAHGAISGGEDGTLRLWGTEVREKKAPEPAATWEFEPAAAPSPSGGGAG